MRAVIGSVITFAFLMQNGVLSNEEIVGYQLQTDVSDQLMLDLDQYNIEEQLIQRKLSKMLSRRVNNYL
jgi:hypothetical protein